MQNFKRIFELIRRTGDRLVITDPEGEETFVVMDIDEYEALLDIAEAIPSDEFNNFEDEIADFAPEQIDEEFLFSPEEQLEQVLPEIEAKTSQKTNEQDQEGEEEQFYLEPVE